MPPVMQSVHSSHVERVGYDMEAKELHVGWKDGGRSVYSGVPADVAHDTMASWSVGNALRTRIKPHYQHRYAD